MLSNFCVHTQTDNHILDQITCYGGKNLAIFPSRKDARDHDQRKTENYNIALVTRGVLHYLLHIDSILVANWPRENWLPLPRTFVLSLWDQDHDDPSIIFNRNMDGTYFFTSPYGFEENQSMRHIRVIGGDLRNIEDKNLEVLFPAVRHFFSGANKVKRLRIVLILPPSVSQRSWEDLSRSVDDLAHWDFQGRYSTHSIAIGLVVAVVINMKPRHKRTESGAWHVGVRKENRSRSRSRSLHRNGDIKEEKWGDFVHRYASKYQAKNET